MKVEIVSTQNIRQPPVAGSLTPFTLSIFDQFMPAFYIPMILFYSATDVQISTKSDILKKSLSETLTHFFPLAGRISDNIRVADEGPAGAGIEYKEARVRGKLLQDILSPPNLEAIENLLPAVKNSSSTDKLLVVQQSVFDCGGMAIGICLSHKVADAAAVTSFLRSWSANARGGGRSSAAPYLSSASRFPPSDAFSTSTYTIYPEQKNTTRRFVLRRSEVASLKAKSCSQSVANPTRVEAVISLFWKCLIRSNSKMKNNPPSSSSGGWQYVNLRNRVHPPLPDNTFGNLLGMYKASIVTDQEEDVDDLASLVSKMRNAKEEYMRDYMKKLSQDSDPGTTLNAVCESFENLFNDASKENVDNYYFSSVCNVDLYGATDFGWGKPIWGTFYMKYTYSVVLSDTRNDEETGGIQVLLSLPKQQMDVFEKDPLLLSYATPNPSINVFNHHRHQQTTSPHRHFARVSSPWFHYYPSTLLSRPNSLSQILRRPAAAYSKRPLCNIHGRTIAPLPSNRFISSLLHLHRHKLIIRFVLRGSQVASLKAKSWSQSVDNPTRVEAVISLFWKCLIRSNSNTKNPSSSSGGWQYVNLRNRINPTLPDNTFGNLLGIYKVTTATEDKNGAMDDLSSLLSKMRHAKEEYMRDYTKKLSQDSDPGTTFNAIFESYKQLGTDLSKQDGDDYYFSSVCNTDLYGAADFGMGEAYLGNLLHELYIHCGSLGYKRR